MDIKNKVSFCTTFAKRIYESDHQTVFNAVKESYPECDFHVYHENSFEMEKYNQEIIFDDIWPGLCPHDVFDCYEGIHEFLASSPFKDVHKLGTPGGHIGLGEKHEEYFNRQSIFWFRKVLAVRHAVEACKTPLLIFLDADTAVDKPIDDTLINYLLDKDFACLKRPPHASEGVIDTGIMSFNLSEGRKGADVGEAWYDYFISGTAFQERIWADHYIMTSVVAKLERERPDISIGGLDNLFGAPFNHIYDYFGHSKGPLHKDRDDGFEGV